MSTLSDILGLLDRWPKWKAINGTPDRLDALERRIAALEASGIPTAAAIPKGRECPKCGTEMELVGESADPTFGDMGMKVHKLKCAGCGLEAERQFQPGTGYL